MVKQLTLKACQEVKLWYHENGQTRKIQKFSGRLRDWTARSLYATLYKDYISALIAHLNPEATPGSALYMKLYQPALSKGLDQLSAEERRALETAAKEYNQIGAPSGLRKSYVA